MWKRSFWHEHAVYWFSNDTIKITGILFLYNKEKQHEKNFLEGIMKIQKLLKVWQMSRMTLEGKIITFKTLAISKNYFSFLDIKSPYRNYKWARKNTKKNFVFWPSKPKIKNEILSSDFTHGGPINVNIWKKR